MDRSRGLRRLSSQRCCHSTGAFQFRLPETFARLHLRPWVWQFNLPLTSSTSDFCLSDSNPFPTVNAGSTTTEGAISVSAVDGFTSLVNLTCSMAGSGSCTMSQSSLLSFPATIYATVNAAKLAAGSYQLTVQGTSGSTTHTLEVPFNVANFQLSGAASLTVATGAQGTANLTITPSLLYAGYVNATCNTSLLPGATCTISPTNPVPVNIGAAEPVAVMINVRGTAAPGIYNVTFAAQDTSVFPAIPSRSPSQYLPLRATIFNSQAARRFQPRSMLVHKLPRRFR